MTAPDQTEPVVTIEDSDRVRLVTLNRPAALNAFNDAQYDGARQALEYARRRDDIAAVVITGAGRAFSAGQDLAELIDQPVHADGAAHGFAPFIDTLAGFEKPLIAAVNGLGVGIGLTLLPHCDLVLMAESARLKAPFAALGVTAEAASTYLLPSLVGWQNAASVLLRGEWVSAAEAKEMGLAWRVLPDGELLEETMAIARQIAAQPIPSLIATKRTMLAARAAQVAAARAAETAEFEKLRGGPANQEAVAAFREGRPPDFTKLAG